MPEDQLHLIQSDLAVTLFEPSRDAGIAELEISRPFVRCDILHASPLTSAAHEAFLDDRGRTRILAILNERDTTGPSPTRWTRSSARLPAR